MSPGERIGAYELVDELGRGGASTVWRARGPDGELVALKRLHSEAPAALAVRLDQEVRILEQLGPDAGFVPVLDAGEDWYAMPLFPRTLRDRLREGPLAPSEALELGRRLAAALGLAHARGVVHRDLKPENVLLDREARPRIADLGVARRLEGATLGLSRTQDLRGTIGYMAPEQQRDAKRVGPPADVFALGAILHECLSGFPAFLAASTVELLRLVDQGPDPRPIHELRPSVPRWLSEVLARCLAKDPAARFPDGAALAAALGPLEVEAAAPQAVARRERGALLFVAGLLLGAVGGWSAGRLAPASDRPAALPSPEPPLAGVAAPVPSADPLMGRLATLERAGDLDSALALIDRALAERPEDAGLLERRAQLRRRSGDRAGGTEDLARLVRLRPDDGMAWNNLGVMVEAADPVAGLAAYDRALALEPENATYLVNRANLRRDQGDLDGCGRDLVVALRVAPGEARVHWAQGELESARGRWREAEQSAAKALALDPGMVLALMLRGYLHGRAGRYPEEIADMNRVIELDPRRAGAWANRGWARIRSGDAEGAKRDYDRALELEPRPRPRWFLERGRAHEALEQWAAAVSDYEEFVRRAPPDDSLLDSARTQLRELRGK